MKTWLLGLFLGNFAGLLLLCAGNPASRRFLEAAFPYTASGYYTGDFVLVLGVVSGALLFPALLTCLARRLCALWGLLPLCLLTIWIVAGKAVNHTLASAFNPPWAFPLAAFLCWTIACGPVSLFRFLRRKQRPVRSASSAPAQRRRFHWLLVSALVVLPLLALAGLGGYNFRHPQNLSFDGKASWLLGGPARVPLIREQGGLYVKVGLADSDELCRLDTGSAGISWPRELHPTGRITGWHSQSYDILGGCVIGQTLLLPRLKIGGYEIASLPIDVLDTDLVPFSAPKKASADDVPLLGNPAFTQTVLTIDYKNAVMVIHPPQYDFTHQPRRAGDRILEMGWQTSYSHDDWKRGFYGTPAILATVNGTPVWCTLDTGWGGPELGLTKDFVDEHLSNSHLRKDSAPLNAAHSSAQVERLHGLSLAFPCIIPAGAKPVALTINALVTPNLGTEGTDADGVTGSAVIGVALMERYRITIDYPRGRVLLEPYARTAPGQKRKKRQPSAKNFLGHG